MNNNQQKYIVLGLGLLLLVLGLTKPDFSKIFSPAKTNQYVTDVVVEKPTTQETIDACDAVIKILKSESNAKVDGMNLASLYSDISRLIELSDNDEVITSTKDLSKVNSIAGALLQLNIKGRYENLSDSCTNVIKSVIGDDDVALDKALRSKAVTAFRNLAWACKEGSK
jgi:hypothetical protein